MVLEQGTRAAEAVIFDLDGVLVSTDEQHYQSWKRLAEEEGIHFDREINRECLGASRMQSLEVVLRNAPRQYTPKEKQELAERKNRYFHELIAELSPDDLLPGARRILLALREGGTRLAVASGSRNAPRILERLGIAELFEQCVSGKDITRSKPSPQIFLLTAHELCVDPGLCVVVEDAPLGVEAARRAGMRVVGISERPLPGASVTFASLEDTSAQGIVQAG